MTSATGGCRRPAGPDHSRSASSRGGVETTQIHVQAGIVVPGQGACESAPKWDPALDRTQDIDIAAEVSFTPGSGSAPAGTPAHGAFVQLSRYLDLDQAGVPIGFRFTDVVQGRVRRAPSFVGRMVMHRHAAAARRYLQLTICDAENFEGQGNNAAWRPRVRRILRHRNVGRPDGRFNYCIKAGGRSAHGAHIVCGRRRAPWDHAASRAVPSSQGPWRLPRPPVRLDLFKTAPLVSGTRKKAKSHAATLTAP